MGIIKSFKLFENKTGTIVYRGLRKDFDNKFDGIQYYAKDAGYARVFGDNVKAFYLIEKDVMDLAVWNSKLSEETRKRYHNNLFTVHATYLDPESDNYAYRYLRDCIYNEAGVEEYQNFLREFRDAKIIKGRDSGNESQVVYAVRDKSLVHEI